MGIGPRWLVIGVSGAMLLSACSGGNGNGPGDADLADGGDGDVDFPEPDPCPWDEPFTWEQAEPARCPAEVGADDPVVTLLEALTLDLTVGIDRSVYDNYGGSIRSDHARLSHFHRLQGDITEVPCFAGNLALRADAAWDSEHPLATIVADAAASLDLTFTVGGPVPHADRAPSPLVAALDVLNEGEEWDRTAAEADAVFVPLVVQRAAARVLLTAAQVVELRNEGITDLIDEERVADAFGMAPMTWIPASSRPGLDPDSPDFHDLFTAGTTGHATLYAGGVQLARTLDDIDWQAVAEGGAESFAFAASTPLGQVLIRGTDDDVYDPEEDRDLRTDFLLVLDVGGADVYRIAAGATSSVDNPVSVNVDLGGDDTYGYHEVGSEYDVEGLLVADEGGRYRGDSNRGPFSLSSTPRQGAGILGYGFLLDLGESRDSYRSLRMSQGFSSLGVGVLWDDGGSDSYEAENGAQGCALLGVAALLDGGGDDTYRSFQNSQGFGWVSSFGILYDTAGDDEYELVVDEVLLYPSPQTPGWANSSLGQGTAFGWRRDAQGTHLSGGLALLRDFSGNDTYEGSTFVQGTGYWMGMGVLADGAGDDRYNGLFYAQGAGAHFALAAFLEGDGADFYNADRTPTCSAIGLGHDFSVVVFVEGGGDDTYVGPDRSIGAAKCHGLGLFVELAGDDYYEALHNRTIGWATDYDWAPGSCGNSTTLPSYGFFVDTDGIDSYIKPDATGYGDNLMWITEDPEDDDAREYSGGIDATGATTFAEAYGGAF